MVINPEEQTAIGSVNTAELRSFQRKVEKRPEIEIKGCFHYNIIPSNLWDPVSPLSLSVLKQFCSFPSASNGSVSPAFPGRRAPIAKLITNSPKPFASAVRVRHHGGQPATGTLSLTDRRPWGSGSAHAVHQSPSLFIPLYLSSSVPRIRRTPCRVSGNARRHPKAPEDSCDGCGDHLKFMPLVLFQSPPSLSRPITRHIPQYISLYIRLSPRYIYVDSVRITPMTSIVFTLRSLTQ